MATSSTCRRLHRSSHTPAKGPIERVRQQQDGEPGGDVDRIGGLLGVEQHRPGERRLEHPVAELAGQTGRQQPPEVAADQEVAHGRRRLLHLLLTVRARGAPIAPPVSTLMHTGEPMNPVPSTPEPDAPPPAAGQASGDAVGATPSPPCPWAPWTTSRPGSLLVAPAHLTDPTFAGAVVYVLDHSETGTIGVVLGRPSEVRIGDVLPGWSELAVEPGVFHVGGPCEADTALCLATRRGAGRCRPTAACARSPGRCTWSTWTATPTSWTARSKGAAGVRRLRGVVRRAAGP